MTSASIGPTVSDLLRPYDLRTEQVKQPLGIDAPTPRLSWKLASGRRGAAPSAYRLTVAASPQDLEDGVLVWDSGRQQDTDGGLGVSWTGPPLRSRTRYQWRVEVWDEAGVIAGAADSWFETAILDPDEWHAAWVGRDPRSAPVVDPPVDSDRSAATASLPPPLYLRRSFELTTTPVRARLYATARGVYEARLNGVRVGDQQLSPGWTEYRHRIQYQTHDVTDLLRLGSNVLGAVVADGWWAGYIGFDPRRPALHYGEAPTFFAQLEVELEDGSTWRVATDGSWVEGPGEIQVADFLMGEHVDRRAAVAGWDSAADAGRQFRPVAVLDEDPGPLVAEPDHPVRITRQVEPVSFQRPDADRVVVDFGQNLVGRVRLTVRDVGPGHRITLRHAETVDADGELYIANLRSAESTDVYVSDEATEQTFEPRFTTHGFRYVEVAGAPQSLNQDDLAAIVLHSDTPWTGEFECSHPLVNQLQSNIAWSQRGNFVSVPTDCPQRDERLGWLADAQVFVATASRNCDVAAFFSRWLRDVRDGQDERGAFRDVSPAVVLDREAAPAWGDAGVIIPWHLWRTYGDRSVLEDSFASMCAWVGHVQRLNSDHIWRHGTGNSYGDWLQVDAATPRDVLATAYYALSVELTARAAAVLDRSKQAVALQNLHSHIKDAFVREFVDDDGHVQGETQTAYLLALAFGLLPEHLVGRAADHLVADIVARGRRLTTGFVGVGLLCPTLSDHGHASVAYDLLLQERYPSWGYTIRNGATTIWERWDGWTEEHGFQTAAMNSFNHYSLGSVGDWLYGRVAGIDQTATSHAYDELLLRPTPDSRLSWARATQETVRGRIACGWERREDGVLTVHASVPPGCTAQLHLPAGCGGTVLEGGLPVHAAPGVTHLDGPQDQTCLLLASGRYSFDLLLDPTSDPATTPPR